MIYNQNANIVILARSPTVSRAIPIPSMTSTPTPTFSDHARAPKQGRSRQSFERIIEATIELLRERGYDQITLAEICERSGVSTGSLYGRVAGKDELLRVVQLRFLDRLGEQFSDEAARISSQAQGLQQVVPAVVASLGRLLQENASVLRAFMLRAPADPVIQEQGQKAAERDSSKFLNLLAACSAEVRHRQPQRAIQSGMLIIYSTQARFLGLDSVGGRGQGSWDELLDDLSDMMLAFLLFEPAK